MDPFVYRVMLVADIEQTSRHKKLSTQGIVDKPVSSVLAINGESSSLCDHELGDSNILSALFAVPGLLYTTKRRLGS